MDVRFAEIEIKFVVLEAVRPKLPDAPSLPQHDDEDILLPEL